MTIVIPNAQRGIVVVPTEGLVILRRQPKDLHRSDRGAPLPG